jgi:energy-coupling factor transporter ATP-binding protein EcfA2
VIRLDRVSYQYPGVDEPALRDVSLEIGPGELVLLAGPSGAGKSTLLRCMNGLVPHFAGGRLSGTIRVGGLDPVMRGPSAMSRTVGFVFQDPEAQMVVDVVEDEVAFALENAGMARNEMARRVEDALRSVGMWPLRGRAVDTLSGGEKQRVAIAAALALGPEVLLLDEPTSQLDPQGAEAVLEAVVRLRDELGLTVVLTEHRLDRVLAAVDRLIYLDGDAVRSGAPREVLREVDVGPPVVQLGRTLGWQPLPLTVEEAPAQPCHSERREAPRLVRRPPVLAVHDLHVSYPGVEALRGVDLELAPGETVALMGPNGSGKTTLLRAIVGLTRARSGAIELDGRSLLGRRTADVCREVGYLPQLSDDLLFAETVAGELLVTLANHGLVDRPPIDPGVLLDRLGLAGLAERYPRDLSVGQRQRVALGAVTVTRPRVLLLDEPTRGLDATLKGVLADLVRGWRDDGMAILLVTHDVELAGELADRVVVLRGGEIAAIGSAHDLLAEGPFATQTARLFPGRDWLTPADALRGLAVVPSQR